MSPEDRSRQCNIPPTPVYCSKETRRLAELDKIFKNVRQKLDRKLAYGYGGGADMVPGTMFRLALGLRRVGEMSNLLRLCLLSNEL